MIPMEKREGIPGGSMEGIILKTGDRKHQPRIVHEILRHYLHTKTVISRKKMYVFTSGQNFHIHILKNVTSHTKLRYTPIT